MWRIMSSSSCLVFVQSRKISPRNRLQNSLGMRTGLAAIIATSNQAMTRLVREGAHSRSKYLLERLPVRVKHIVLQNMINDANTIHKKCQSRIYCLQKLRNIGVASDILEMYSRACIQSVLTLSFMCWYGSLGVRGKKVLNDVVNVCSKIVGKKQACMQDLYKRRLKRKTRQIAGDQSHVLAKFFELLPSGRRYRTVKGKRDFLRLLFLALYTY